MISKKIQVKVKSYPKSTRKFIKSLLICLKSIKVSSGHKPPRNMFVSKEREEKGRVTCTINKRLKQLYIEKSLDPMTD